MPSNGTVMAYRNLVVLGYGVFEPPVGLKEQGLSVQAGLA